MLQSDHNPANAGISKPGKTSHRKPKLWSLRRRFPSQNLVSPTQKTLNSAAAHLAHLSTSQIFQFDVCKQPFATPPDKPTQVPLCLPTAHSTRAKLINLFHPCRPRLTHTVTSTTQGDQSPSSGSPRFANVVDPNPNPLVHEVKWAIHHGSPKET